MTKRTDALKKTFKKAKIKDNLFVLSLIILPLAQFAVFWIYVNFDSFLMAFRRPLEDEFTLINFERFFFEWRTAEGFLQNVLVNTVTFFIVSNLICMPMVLFATYFLFKKVYGYKAFRVIFYLPSIISGTIMALMFKYLCLGDGPIIQFLQLLGIKLSPELLNNGLLNHDETAFPTILFYAVWSGFGLNMILYLGALMRVPEEVFESAKIDGIGIFREFINMAVPLIWPTVTTMVILNLAGLFTWFGPVMVLTEGWHNTTTMGWYLFSKIKFSTDGNYNYPAAVGLMCTVVSIPIVFGIKAILDKITDSVEY